jgi:phosphodiesterase/alkaline phosphatase D-like protein
MVWKGELMKRISIRSSLCLLFAFCLFLIPSLSLAWQNGDIIYVDKNAHGNGSGLSWINAFNTIQGAINSVNPGTEVSLFVAQGVYLEHNIILNDGIKLYGSFESYESSLGERRDVWTNDHWTVIDAERKHRVLNMKNRTEVNGFILRNGLRDYTLQSGVTLDDSRGGGIYITCDDDAVVRNNLIEHCAVFWQGGGIFIEGSCNNTPAAPLIEFNVIRSSTGYCGGGIEIAGVPEGAPGGTDAIIRHNVLRNNPDGGTSELGFGLELWTEYEDQCSPRMGDFYNNIIIGFRNERDWNIDAADVWAWARNSVDRSFISQDWYQGEFLYNGCYKFDNPDKYNIFGSDPMFVDETNNNYRLRAGSPCIGTGRGGVNIGLFPYSGDTQAPVISSVASSGITSSNATITWSTNEPADSQVEYGLTASYGSSTPLNTSLVTSHSMALSGLSAGTTYHYRVKSKDAAGNLAVRGDYNFTTTTLPDTQFPVISNVASSAVTSSGATITWTTNEVTDSQVEYGLTTSYGSSTPLNTSLVTSHSMALSGLSASTTYHYRVKSKDATANQAVSGDYSFTTSAQPPAGWDGYGYRRLITIDNANLGSSCSGDLFSFPVLINLSGTWLKTTGNGGHVYSSNGYDIIFKASDGVTQLNHEVEKYDGSTGTLIAYVRIPTLDYDQDTLIYVYYGNSAITTYQSIPTGVWDSNYKGVWHLKENPSGTAPQMKDSTLNANNGTSYGAMTSGDQVAAKIGGGLDLETDDYISAANNGSALNVGQAFTLEAWIKRDTTGSRGLLTKTYGDAYSFKLSFTSSDVLRLDVYNGSGYNNVQGNAISDTNWHYVGAYSNGTSLKLFTDGVVHSSTGTRTGTIPYDSNTLYMGAGMWSSTPRDFFDGKIDEVRISNLVRSDCWIKTSYLNQNSPSTFSSVGSEESTPTVDTQAPVISSVASSGITSSGATITWWTNEASDSQVEYGLTTSYGSSTPLNTSLVTSHSVALSGLTASTTYHFRVKSRDAVANLAVSGDYSFTTSAPADTQAPVISSVASSDITTSGATITWTTDEASDSQVEYGLTAGYGSSTPLNTSLVTSHSVAVSGLTASTTYHYRVKSKDAAGNLATGQDYTFTTAAPPDITPPVISSVASSGITSGGATITWTTNEASDSQVEYGLTAGYGSSTPLNTSLVTSHSVALSGLSASTTYHYRVKSRDTAGNLGTSGDYSFATSAQPSGGWDGYSYRRSLTIDYTKVSPCSSNLSNFPVLMSLSGTWLKTTGNGGPIYSSNGYDIIFKASDGVTQLNHEIEKYDGSAGTLVAWVKVPILSNTANTTVYIYYGNSAITTYQSTPTGVWDSNYKGVWHLKENPSGTAPQMKDSTANANNGTSYGGMTSGDLVAGKIGGGLDLETDDYISAANSSSTLNVGQAFTLEAWIKRDATGPKTVVTKRYGNAYSFKLSFTSSDVLRLDVYNGNGYNNVQGNTITDTNWHYVGAYSNGTSLKLITDGVVHSNTGTKTGAIPYDSNSLWMGVGIWSGNPVDYFDGIIDEVRASNVVRSDCWIKTGYLNQNSPSTFYAVGNEE